MVKGTRATFIYGELHKSITNGKLLPGDPLLEADLSEAYGVSRTPIREAIRRLQHEGLVELTSFVGARVARVSLADVLSAFDARIWLEPQVFAHAANSVSPELVVDLRSAMASMPEHSSTRAEALKAVEADFTFHRIVFRAVGNRYAINMLESVLSVTRRAVNLSPPPRFTKAHSEHTAIMAVFAVGDGAEAASLVHKHLTNARIRYSGGYVD